MSCDADKAGVDRRVVAASARPAAALSMVLVLICLAGCTQTTASVTARSTNPATALVLSAWRSTLAQDSAQLEFDVVDSATGSSTETGVVGFAHDQLQLERTTPAGDASEIRVVGGSTYVGASNQLPAAMASALASGLPPGTTLAPPSPTSSALTWIRQRASAGDEGLLGPLGEPLLWDTTVLAALITAAGGPKQKGLANVRGTPTTEYTVTPSTGAYTEVDFYIDSQHLVRRLHVHLRVPSDAAASPTPGSAQEDSDETLELYGFGVAIHVLPPTSSTAFSG